MSIAYAGNLTPIPANPCSIPAAVPVTSSVPRAIQTPRTRQTKVSCRGIAPRRLLPRGRAMLDSIRVRLTLWYTGVLTLVLVVLALITYFIFWQSTLQRTAVNLSELSAAFLTTLDADAKSHRAPHSL